MSDETVNTLFWTLLVLLNVVILWHVLRVIHDK
jgi:hypothetical protein